ncbi:MAG: hypothetical protein JNL66_19620 [Alphaproteobacteria bacterium]|nr:hypothetical protein [Alphaproteobacteria bacterium]
MRRSALALTAGAVVVAIGLSARAQSPAVRFSAAPPDEAVVELMEHARADLPRVSDNRGRPFAANSPSDRNGAVIPIVEARTIIDTGFASGAARWCQLDWQQNLRFLLNEQRARGIWDERQLAFIGVLHAHAMSAVLDANRDRSCGAGDRLLIGDYLRRRWH